MKQHLKRLATCWWRFLGTFRDWRADWVEIQVAVLSYQVAVICEMPETAERERRVAIETFHRIGRYHGWVSSNAS